MSCDPTAASASTTKPWQAHAFPASWGVGHFISANFGQHDAEYPKPLSCRERSQLRKLVKASPLDVHCETFSTDLSVALPRLLERTRTHASAHQPPQSARLAHRGCHTPPASPIQNRTNVSPVPIPGAPATSVASVCARRYRRDQNQIWRWAARPSWDCSRGQAQAARQQPVTHPAPTGDPIRPP
jgi:hypothetical protein